MQLLLLLTVIWHLAAARSISRPPEEGPFKAVRVFANGENIGGQRVYLKEAHFDHDIGQMLRSYTLNGFSNHYPAGNADVYMANGVALRQWGQVEEHAWLYVVAIGDTFMWPAVAVGHTVTVPISVFRAPSSSMEEGRLVQLETLSVAPRIFKIRNFLTDDECDALVAKNSENMTLSAVGKLLNSDQSTSPKTTRRTSDNNFDSKSPAAAAALDRSFDLLRVRPNPAQADGLQVVRYQQNQAYTVHTDYFPIGYDPHANLDPSNGGTNRYATVFAYLVSDGVEGGETVFPHAERLPGQASAPWDRVDDLFEKGSWEHTLGQVCSESLAVKPVKGQAVLFYSQTSSGRMDPLSEHGACPVLRGTKFGANLWVWNRAQSGRYSPYTVVFTNTLAIAVEVSYHGTTDRPMEKPVVMALIEPKATKAFQGAAYDKFVTRLAGPPHALVGIHLVPDQPAAGPSVKFDVRWAPAGSLDTLAYEYGLRDGTTRAMQTPPGQNPRQASRQAAPAQHAKTEL